MKVKFEIFKESKNKFIYLNVVVDPQLFSKFVLVKI